LGVTSVIIGDVRLLFCVGVLLQGPASRWFGHTKFTCIRSRLAQSQWTAQIHSICLL